MMDSFAKQNALRGKGKLGIFAELLAGVSAKANSLSNTKAGGGYGRGRSAGS